MQRLLEDFTVSDHEVRIGASIYILHRSIKDAVEALQWRWGRDGCIAEGQIVKQMDVRGTHERDRMRSLRTACWTMGAVPQICIGWADRDTCCISPVSWTGSSARALTLHECKHSCRAIDVDNSTHATKHVRDDCQYDFAPTPPIVASIIENCGVPVVIMKMNDLGEIEALKYASAIVVIDDMFQRVTDESITRTEMFAWFCLSDCGRRLWTLQEAVLVSNLYIALFTHFWRPGYFTDHDEGRLPTLQGYKPEPTYETTAEDFHGRWLSHGASQEPPHFGGGLGPQLLSGRQALRDPVKLRREPNQQERL